jgi:dienelactone hydrolase
MSKAGRLAMELNAERKRLKQEMEELQLEVEDLKPATPTGTVDSYVKWVATIFGVVGVFIMSAGFSTAGQVAYLLAACSWVYVGHCWNDKAIMIGSAISGTAVLMNLVQVIV